jgi:hypothetical protein
MSDQFPMPQTVASKPVSDYAPRRANAVGAEAVAAEIERSAYAGADKTERTPLRYNPPVIPSPSTHTTAIREAIKKLTHREMREMVAAIFAAHVKDRPEPGRTADAISKDDLADVLDAFAHGE